MEKDISKFEFGEWPLDLLVDYAIKIHHRKTRVLWHRIQELLERMSGDGGRVDRVKEIFSESVENLSGHFDKEEQVLFPYLYQLYDAFASGSQIEQIHCGTVENPIRVMMMEHDAEGIRQDAIKVATDEYHIPQQAGKDYVELMSSLKLFADNLHEHVHIENDIIFPGFIKLEESCIQKY